MSELESAAGLAAAPTRDRVAMGIKAAIADGTLVPGTRLSEREICTQYEVSRTVVRETLRQLEAQGFVTVQPNKGAVVAEISYNDAEALFEVRGALESLACSLFARRGSLPQKQQLIASINASEAAMNGGTIDEILTAKDSFYDALLDGAGNSELTTTLRVLHARIQLLRRYSLSAPGRHTESLKELKEISRAIIAGDIEGARNAGLYHVEQAKFAALPRIFAEIAASE